MTDKQLEAMLNKVEAGTAVLTHVKKINGGKFSFQVVEKIKGEPNILALLNASDERFSQDRFRPAWINGTAQDSIKQFGLNVTVKQLEALQIGTSIPDSKLKEGITKLNLGILNPTIGNIPLHVQIEESVSPFYEDQTPKRAGSDGDFLTIDGAFIYTTTRVVGGSANHVRLVHNGRVPAGAYGKVSEESMKAARASFIGTEEPA